MTLRIRTVIQELEAERADVRRRLEWLDSQIVEFKRREREDAVAHLGVSSAANGAGRQPQPTTRASTRARIIDYLEEHPGATGAIVAEALDLNPKSAATTLSKLVRDHRITKADVGYAASAASSSGAPASHAGDAAVA